MTDSSEGFLPALRQLHEADPLAFIERLQQVHEKLAQASAPELVAAYQTFATALALYDFNKEQRVVVDGMQKVALARMRYVFQQGGLMEQEALGAMFRTATGQKFSMFDIDF